MRQSNGYILVFSAVLTIILGGLLAFAAVSLRPQQKKQEDIFRKKSILNSVMEIGPNDDVLSIYKEKIQSFVVDFQGNTVNEREGVPVIAENIEVGKEYKKEPKDRLYPIFQIVDANGQPETFILPVYGNGLWDRIYGYIALDKDCNTVKGAVFDHIGETPGLGARITEKEFQTRFVDKRIKDESGKLVGINVLKGEDNKPSSPHEVDGLSGATITGEGVEKMLINYMGYYEGFFQHVQNNSLTLAN